MNRSRWTAATLLCLALTMPTATTISAGEPSASDEPVTLRMARGGQSIGPEHEANGQQTVAQHFQQTVAELSGGDLQVDVAWERFDDQIIGRVASGDLDLGWVPTRVLGEVGIASFDALTAPWLIDSYALQQAVFDSDIPERMLADSELESLGVTGLAVVAGGLHKPMAVEAPLLGPDDYEGITFRTYRSAGHAATITALGATHTDEPFFDQPLVDGTFQAIENPLLWYAQIDANQTPYVTLNANLWPQTAVLIANPDTLAALSEEQAGWLRDAIADTSARSAGLSAVDAELLDTICSLGGRFANASDADLVALREAVEPVYAELTADADTVEFLAEIEALKATVTPERLAIPEGCSGERPALVAEGTDDPRALDGSYTVEWTKEELIAAGVPAEYWDRTDLPEMAGRFTWTFDDGEWTQTEPGPCTGTYGVTGDVVDIQWTLPCRVWRFTATWELSDDALVFSDTLLDGIPNPVLEIWLTGKPWERVETETVAAPLTLRMATPYCDDLLAAGTGSLYTPAVLEFVNQVRYRSGDTIRIEIAMAGPDGEYCALPDGEQQVVQSAIDGDADLAWAGTRVFDTFGVNGFRALHAPFLVDSYELQDAILASDIPAELLADLDAIGLGGLAVLGGGLRKPIGREGPLLHPDDFAGITFQIYRSDTQAAAVTALGATPTDVVAGERDAGLLAGEIDGIEHSMRTYAARSRGLTRETAPFVAANVNLWPETLALIANPAAVAALTAEQQSLLREAAIAASAASVAMYDHDAEYVADVCSRGTRFTEASADDLAAMAAAVEPVYDDLRTDEQTATLIDRIVELKSTVTAEPLTIPEECTGVAPERVAEGADDPSVLNGSFNVEWTVDELLAAGVPQEAIDQFPLDGTTTLTFTDGTWTITGTGQRPGFPDQPCTGTYSVTGDDVDIQWTPPCGTWLYTANWELTDAGLVFSNPLLDGLPNPVLDGWLAGKPWEQVE